MIGDPAGSRVEDNALVLWSGKIRISYRVRPLEPHHSYKSSARRCIGSGNSEGRPCSGIIGARRRIRDINAVWHGCASACHDEVEVCAATGGNPVTTD